MKKLPESELEIMLMIWEAGAPVTSDYIMDRLDKAWVKPTVLNFLSRLCERGFLKCEKEGRHNVYTPCVEKDVYLTSESRSFLEKLHQNSLKSLLVSLYDGKKVSKEELDELRAFIEEAR